MYEEIGRPKRKNTFDSNNQLNSILDSNRSLAATAVPKGSKDTLAVSRFMAMSPPQNQISSVPLSQRKSRVLNPWSMSIQRKVKANTLNMVGEHHGESDRRRAKEKNIWSRISGGNGKYMREYQFRDNNGRFGDLYDLKVRTFYLYLDIYIRKLENYAQYNILESSRKKVTDGVKKYLKQILKHFHVIENDMLGVSCDALYLPSKLRKGNATRMFTKQYGDAMKEGRRYIATKNTDDYLASVIKAKNIALSFIPATDNVKDLDFQRSIHMHESANRGFSAGIVGMWKVGNDHIDDIRTLNKKMYNPPLYEITTIDEFNADYF